MPLLRISPAPTALVGQGQKSLCKDTYTLARCEMTYNSLAPEQMCQMLIILFPGEK